MPQQPAQPFRTAQRAFALAVAFSCVFGGNTTEELQHRPETKGHQGGWLQTAQRSQPATFNPVVANDISSRDVINTLHADLIHVNRSTLQAEPALASSWKVSPDGRVYTLTLRRGIRFSDGHPMDADDVVFTFAVYLDQSVQSTQRNLLVIDGTPVVVRRTGSHTVQFELPKPYASALRLFDNVPVLPKHLLLKAYQEGRLDRAWGTDTPPDQIAGLGPFRLKENVPGQRVVLERNPYYWKADAGGRRLPYLDGVVFHFVPAEEVQILRFLSGDLSVIDRLGARNYLEIQKREKAGRIRVYNAGPGLEYQFLVFNQDKPGAGADSHRSWFRDVRFRRAVSRAIDRQAISRLVYQGLADPLWGHVTPGNTPWVNRDISRAARSVDEARQLLRTASFSWKDGALHDASGVPVEFSILYSSSNIQRARIATIIQDDLRQLGMKVSLAGLESRTTADRVFNRRDFDAALMAIDSGDTDPNSEMNIWASGGSLHLWNWSGTADTEWEKEIDRLMKAQMTTLDQRERKRMYDRVQQLAAEHVPFICLASPHVLIGASARLGNFRPSILRPNALWNIESLYFRDGK